MHNKSTHNDNGSRSQDHKVVLILMHECSFATKKAYNYIHGGIIRKNLPKSEVPCVPASLKVENLKIKSWNFN